MKTILKGDIIGLDLGKKRTGVARVHTSARLSQPLDLITMNDDEGDFIDNVQKLIDEYKSCALVVGIPRGLDGQDTDQTTWALGVVELLRAKCSVPLYEIDEAGTTKAAEAIATSGQNIDSVAAQIILDDFVAELARGRMADVSL